MGSALGNRVGRVFAMEVGRPELWPQQGPARELRLYLASHSLPLRAHVLLRIAVDFFDGTRTLSLSIAMRQLQGDDHALLFLAQFASAGLADDGTSLHLWTERYFAERVQH